MRKRSSDGIRCGPSVVGVIPWNGDAFYDRGAPHFFFPSIWELQTAPNKLIWRKSNLLPDKKAHGLSTRREPLEKKKNGSTCNFRRFRVKEPPSSRNKKAKKGYNTSSAARVRARSIQSSSRSHPTAEAAVVGPCCVFERWSSSKVYLSVREIILRGYFVFRTGAWKWLAGSREQKAFEAMVWGEMLSPSCLIAQKKIPLEPCRGMTQRR